MSDAPQRLNAALLGRYRVERQLGEGGMATVYLADDLRHERKVALKVLKPELAAVIGAERFLAEIKTTANLQHPHILPLFDSGEADGFLFYVMPYVEGESLRARLDREHQLPVEEVVRTASKVAEALDYAHRRGVVHRDIKPANILLHDGEPVVTDFGIALALSAAGGNRLTETGLSLGTPHYMSPEQATGDQSVGPATDVWALGCVLYEMLVGEPPYTGSTPQAVLGKIITREPEPVTANRKSVPPNVEAAIAKALEKVPADRFSGARDFAAALTDPRFRHAEPAAVGSGRVEGRNYALWAGLAAAALGALALGGSLRLRAADAPTPAVVRFTVPVGEGSERYIGWTLDPRPASTSVALSPDGELLAYSAWGMRTDTTPINTRLTGRLYLRRLDRDRAEPIADTEGGWGPFFSHDGAWLGFWVELSGRPSLRRMSVADGRIETLIQEAVVDAGWRGATWGEDGTIVYGGWGGLHRVSPSGRTAEVLLHADSLGPGFDFRAHVAQPDWLPGGEVLVFHANRFNATPERAEIMALDVRTGRRTTVLADAMHPRYVETGHLLFMRQGTLMAVGFDIETLEVEGEPISVLEDVMHAVFTNSSDRETGAAQVAVSRVGHLAYVRGGTWPVVGQPVLRVGLDGVAEPFLAEPRRYIDLRVSPEGDRLAFTAGPGRAISLYIHDLRRGVTQQLNTGGSYHRGVEWSADGRTLVFGSDREDFVLNIYRMPADLSGPPERLAPSNRPQIVSSWSPQGVIAYLEGNDIWILPPDGEPAPFFTPDAQESYPTFSPDGRWLAYTSAERGGPGVYVRPYPGPGPATLVSGPAGGTEPLWSPDQRRLYYRDTSGRMVVDVVAEDAFRAGRARRLITPWPYAPFFPITQTDVLPDGALVVSPTAPLDLDAVALRTRFAVGEIQVVLNFFDELRQRMAN